MRYSEKLSKQRDFYSEIVGQTRNDYINKVLQKRYKAIHHDRSISKEDIREAILFDQYICGLVEKSRNNVAYDYEKMAIREYIIRIYYVIFNAKSNNGQAMLYGEGLASKNEFAIFSSSMDQLRNLFKNDSEISNILNIIDDKYNKLISNIIKPVWKKYEEGNQLTDNEFKVLLRYFIANTPNFNEEMIQKQELFFKNTIKKLLIDNDGRNLMADKNWCLILEFISKHAVYQKLYQQFKAINEKDTTSDYYFIYCYDMKLKNNTYAYASKNEICYGYIGYENFNILSFLLHSLYHEVRHCLQFYYAYSCNKPHKLLSSLSGEITVMQVISKYYDKNDYFRNYSNQEIEHDANRNAIFTLIKLVESLKSDELKFMIEKLNEKMRDYEKKHHLTIRKNQEEKLDISSNYKFKLLDEIIKDNPNLINKYSLLKLLYENGVPKNALEILTSCNIAYLNENKHGVDFILEYFSYRNAQNDHLFEQVLNETNMVKKELILNNMFLLFREARNEIYEYHSKFETYSKNPDDSINSIKLEIIKRKVNQYIELMKKIFAVLIKADFGLIYPDFNRYYYNSNSNKLDEYVTEYEALMSKISESGNNKNKIS